MALVRISHDLIDEVKNTIQRLSDASYLATIELREPNKDEETLKPLLQAVEKKVWGANAHLKPLLPQDWLNSTDNIDVKVMGREWRINTPGFRYPPKGAFKAGYSYIDVQLTDDEIGEEVLNKVREYNRLNEEHNVKYSSVKTQVIGFLKNCKSLNDALNKYPDLAIYIPQPFLDRVAEIVERKPRQPKEKPEEADIGIDRDLVRSAGLMGAAFINLNK